MSARHIWSSTWVSSVDLHKTKAMGKSAVASPNCTFLTPAPRQAEEKMATTREIAMLTQNVVVSPAPCVSQWQRSFVKQ